MIYISYPRVEYDIVSPNNFELLFQDLDHEVNCRKYFKNY